MVDTASTSKPATARRKKPKQDSWRSEAPPTTAAEKVAFVARCVDGLFCGMPRDTGAQRYADDPRVMRGL